jgi:hypothetical protein
MSFWTDEAKGKASKLWRDGASATEIAHLFGCSRNSVIGLTYRNRDLFPHKPERKAAPRQAKREPMARPFVVRKVKPVRPAETDLPKAEPIEEKLDQSFVPSKPVGILALDSRTCRWPLWPMSENPGADGLYCGEETAKDSAWCWHHRLAARDKSRSAA